MIFSVCGLAPNTAGIIAGAIIAVLLALIIIAIILFCCCRARNRKKYEKEISYEIRYGQRFITPSILCRIPKYTLLNRHWYVLHQTDIAV
jgi:hypothetical protein